MIVKEKNIKVRSVFKAYMLILKAAINVLASKHNSKDIYDVNSYQVTILNRIYHSITTIDILLNQCNDPISAYGLLRTIIDSISAYCFIYDNNNQEEVEFRHFLYMLDGCASFNELFSHDIINTSFKIPEESDVYSVKAQQSVDKIRQIQDCIEEKLYGHHYLIISPDTAEKIIHDREWKYRSIECNSNKNYYDWRGVYEKIGCDQNIVDFVVKYLSQFVHGLYISNTMNSELMAHHYLIYSILQSFIMKLNNSIWAIFKKDLNTQECMDAINTDEIHEVIGKDLRDILSYLRGDD